MRGESEDQKGSEGERKQHEHAAFIWFLFYFTFYFVDYYLKVPARLTTPTIGRAHEGR
jgi:hypothetical protein